MYEDQPVAHYTYTPSDKFTSRSITAVPGNTSENLFLFSTNHLKKDNEVHLIQFNEEEGKIKCQGIFNYSGVVNKVFTHPTDETLAYASVSNYTGSAELHKAILFRLPKVTEGSEERKTKQALEPELEIENNLELNSIISNGKNNNLIFSDSVSVNLYDVEKKEKQTLYKAENGTHIIKSEIDPHHPDLVASIQNNNIIVTDMRDSQTKYEIKNAHTLNVTDLDFNPNKQWCIITGGEDCQIKFWDIRKPALPLKTLDNSNCVESVRYNRQHDLLLLSSNSAGSVNLHKVTSVSSAPVLSTAFVEKGTAHAIKEEDLLVKCYEEQEDSAYSCAWSAGSAWIFASISYRASVVVSMVPPAEKYKILL